MKHDISDIFSELFCNVVVATGDMLAAKAGWATCKKAVELQGVSSSLWFTNVHNDFFQKLLSW